VLAGVVGVPMPGPGPVVCGLVGDAGFVAEGVPVDDGCV
jgi:hypothetical protein